MPRMSLTRGSFFLRLVTLAARPNHDRLQFATRVAKYTLHRLQCQPCKPKRLVLFFCNLKCKFYCQPNCKDVLLHTQLLSQLPFHGRTNKEMYGGQALNFMTLFPRDAYSIICIFISFYFNINTIARVQ